MTEQAPPAPLDYSKPLAPQLWPDFDKKDSVNPEQIADTAETMFNAADALSESHEALLASLEKLANVATTQAVTAHIPSLTDDGDAIVGGARMEYREAKQARRRDAVRWLRALAAFEQAVGEEPDAAAQEVVQFAADLNACQETSSEISGAYGRLVGTVGEWREGLARIEHMAQDRRLEQVIDESRRLRRMIV